VTGICNLAKKSGGGQEPSKSNRAKHVTSSPVKTLFESWCGIRKIPKIRRGMQKATVHTVAKIIKAVMSSAAEAELGGLFINAKTAVPIWTTLEELGHKQPPTPIQTDNLTACGVANNEIQPKATKAMDMRIY
jgi:hypothetical protein